MYYRAKVEIHFKKSVLEPQGQAILLSLHEHGDKDFSLVRMGKLIELDIEALSRQEALSKVDKVTKELLFNPVMETYAIEISELSE